MAGFDSLNRIQDEPTRTVLAQAFKRIQDLQREVTTLKAAALSKGTTINAAGLRVTNGAQAHDEDDLPTLGQVRLLIDQVKKATY